MAAEGDLLAGKYRIERFLGSGGFASVWAARNELIDRPVALKVLSDTFTRNADIVQRFVREAKLACKSLHPTIVRVEDIAQTDEGTPFLVMDLLEGQTLSEKLKTKGRLPEAESLAIMTLVLRGLAAAHDRAIIHRDIKPSNIFLMQAGSPDPPVRILDFGVAKDLADDENLTGTGQLVGTPSFLAPEILLSRTKDEWLPAVDVFAAGMVLFLMLTGRLPYDEDKGMSPHVRMAKRILMLEAADALPGPSDVAEWVTPAIDNLVRRALALEPGDRYRDATQMLDAVEEASAFLASGETTADLIAAVTEETPAPPARAGEEAGSSDTPVSASEAFIRTEPTMADGGEATTPEPSSSTVTPVMSPAPPELSHSDESQATTPLGWGTDPGATDSAAGPGRSRALWLALAVGAVACLGLVLGVGIAITQLSEPEESAPAPPPGSLVTTTAPPPTPPVAPAAAVAPTDSAPAEPPALPEKAPPEPEPTPEPELTTVKLMQLPRDARVTFAGKAVAGDAVEGTTGTKGLLVVRARGYRELRKQLTLDRDHELNLAPLLQRPRPAPITPPWERGRSSSQARPTPPSTQRRNHIDGRRQGSKIKILSQPNR